MRAWRILSLRLKAMFRRAKLEREMDAEMADHLASEAEALMARGMSPEDALRHAGETMGRVPLIQEECRDARGVDWWDHLRQDVTFAARLLARNKTYSATAIVTMALGIGSASAVFGVIDSVFLRPLPYPQPERLIAVGGIGMRGPFEMMRAGSKVADYAAFEGVRAFNLVPNERAVPERVKGSEVSANFFSVLGIAPVLGRTFADGEDRTGRTRTAVISHSFWQQRYGGQRDIAGRQLVLDEVPHEIAGVMPPDFQYPSPDVKVWTPMVLDPRSVGDYWGRGGTQIFARLRTGQSVETMGAELHATVPRIRASFPWRMPDAWGGELSVRDMREALVASARSRTWMLFGAVGLVMLIAVVNVANLMIGHTTARAREFAMRTSLGATAGRLGRQLLTEALVLTAAGGLAGVLLGFAQVALLRSLLPANTPRLAEIAMDGRVLAFSVALSLLSGIIVGVWPAWRARKLKTGGVSAEGGRAATTGRSGLRIDGLLVMTEAAFATLLVVGSGLMFRSLWALVHVDPGFQVQSIVTAELSPAASVASTPARRAALWDAVRTRLLAYPRVSEVAAMNVLPLTPEITAFAAAIEDHPLPAEQPQYVLWSTSVTPEHADVLGVRLLQGRKFNASDHARSERVVIVSKSTAQRFWPGGSPVGRRLKPVSDRDWRQIVGVVDDVKTFGFAGPPGWVHGEVYLPMSQSVWKAAPASLIVRVDGDPSAFQGALAGMVQEVCPTCAVSNIARMEDVVSRAVEAPRSTAWLIGGFTLLALSIAAAGIYGVVSHAVLRRTRELGVRLALGAGRGTVASLVLVSSIRMVTAGCALGLGVAWLAAGLTRNLLFGIPPHDLLSFTIAPALLLLVACVASAAPTLRAVRIDPARCLREG